MVLDNLYQCGIRWSVPCGISNTQSVFQWYWTVCISVALDGLYLSDIGQPVSWWHWSACILVELNSLWLSENSLRDLMVLSTGCYTCTGVQLYDKTDDVCDAGIQSVFLSMLRWLWKWILKTMYSWSGGQLAADKAAYMLWAEVTKPFWSPSRSGQMAMVNNGCMCSKLFWSYRQHKW